MYTLTILPRSHSPHICTDIHADVHADTCKTHTLMETQMHAWTDAHIITRRMQHIAEGQESRVKARVRLRPATVVSAHT